MEIEKFSNRAVNLRSTINAIISETIDGGTPQPFSYDDAGRLLDDGSLTYAWDRADRLLETDDGVTTINYEYNGLGQRVRQDSTDYLLDTVPRLPRVIVDKNGSTINRYVFSDHGLLRHQKPDSSWVHPLRDGLGSVRYIVDASLDPVYSVNHTPYGERWNAQGSSPMPFGFTGEWQDPNELLFLRARYYNPAQAAFLSLDPLEGGLGDVAALNRYGYVTANPSNFVDRSGMIGETPPSGCGGDSGGGFPRQGTDSCDTSGQGGSVTLAGAALGMVNPARTDFSLLNNWGVVLTVECSPELRNVQWTTTQKNNLWSAFSSVDLRLRQVVNSTFEQVFGALEIRHVGPLERSFINEDGQEETVGVGARTHAPNPWILKIAELGRGGDSRSKPLEFGTKATGLYGLNVSDDKGIQATVVHELGHIFDYRTGQSMTASMGVYQLPTINTEFKGNYVGNKWENTANLDGEKVADHFLNWVYDSYHPAITPYQFPSDDESDYAKLISGFWTGEETIFSVATRGPGPGIKTWVSMASSYSNPVTQLLLVLASVYRM